MMSVEKDRSKTWPKHYQYLVYEVEQSNNTEQRLLEFMFKTDTCQHWYSNVEEDKTAVEGPYLQADDLVLFAINFEINVNKLKSGGGEGRGCRSTHKRATFSSNQR